MKLEQISLWKENNLKKTIKKIDTTETMDTYL